MCVRGGSTAHVSCVSAPLPTYAAICYSAGLNWCLAVRAPRQAVRQKKGMKRPCSVILVNGLSNQAMQDFKCQRSHCCNQVICHQQKKYSIDDYFSSGHFGPRQESGSVLSSTTPITTARKTGQASIRVCQFIVYHGATPCRCRAFIVLMFSRKAVSKQLVRGAVIFSLCGAWYADNQRNCQD